MVLWMLSIAISVALLVISAAMGADVPQMANGHLFVAGLISTVMALLAISETRRLIRDRQPQMVIAGSLMRFMGLVWAWAALVISITYGTGILEWSEWPKYFVGSMLLSGLCLFVSRMMIEHSADGEDETMLTISRYIASATLLVSVISAGVFGVTRMNGLAEQGAWAANHVFMFGAQALAAISAYLLKAGADEAQ